MALRFRNPFYNTNKQTMTQQINSAVRNLYNQAFFWGSLSTQATDDDLNPKRYIEYAYNINPDVYSIIQQITNKFTSIPYCIEKIDDKKEYSKYQRLNNTTKYNYSFVQEVKALNLKQKALEDVEYEMPLKNPNPEQTWKEFWALSNIFLQTTGNVYWYMLRPGEGARSGEPIGIYVLPSHLMEIVLKPTYSIGLDSPVDYYILREYNKYVQFKKEDVIHIKYPNPNYDENGAHLYGQSPLRAAYKNILATNYGLNLSVNTMKNGGAFGFLHAKDSQTPLTPEQAKAIKSRLTEMNTSTEELGRIAGISQSIGFTRISLTTDELKPFDYFKYNTKQLCNVLGWDDKLLNSDDGAKYDNMKVAEKRVVMGKTVPDIILFQEYFNTYFLPLFKGYEDTCIDFKVKELPEMQQDYKTMTEWIVQLTNTGYLTRRKGLAILGMPTDEIDDLLDKRTVKDDIMTLEDALMPDENNIV